MVCGGRLYVNDRNLYVNVDYSGGKLSEIKMFHKLFLVISSNRQVLLIYFYFLFVKRLNGIDVYGVRAMNAHQRWQKGFMHKCKRKAGVSASL